jgi:hypothetical protein
MTDFVPALCACVKAPASTRLVGEPQFYRRDGGRSTRFPCLQDAPLWAKKCSIFKTDAGVICLHGAWLLGLAAGFKIQGGLGKFSGDFVANQRQ